RTSAATGFGATMAVVDHGDEHGTLLASEPEATGLVIAGAVTGAQLAPLIDNGSLIGVSTVLPEDLGTPSAGTFAQRIARIHDIDNDGHEDFCVGSPGLVINGSAVGAFVVSGRTLRFGGLTVAPPAGNPSFGTEVADVGDVDGDGRADLAFGAPDDGARGRVFLRLSTAPGALRTIEPPSGLVSVNARFGWSVAGIGDIDGDGRNEILIGAPMDSVTNTSVAGCVDPKFNPRTGTGDCAGSVFLVASRRLADGVAAPCFSVNRSTAMRLGASLRALGPSLIPAEAPDFQRIAIGAPGLGVDDPATTGDDAIGQVMVATITWDDATQSCEGTADILRLNNSTADLLGETMAR
ncbi:MAG: hypothetical protein FJ137_19580, partial [Deltaproteobacteria bacterium]|nr:hypothetical protein [Deltaproteobacteria bacterium]